MNIAIVGTGYVGLVAGVCFAETGHNVVCIDIDLKKIEKLSQGEVVIYEPGLSELLQRNLKANRIRFSPDLPKSIEDATFVFIAVGTPQGEDGSADLKYVLGVAEEIGKSLNSYKVIVDKSTVPVGTETKVRATIAKHTSIEFDVVSNPEFLKEGAAIQDFMHPDRIVIGANSEKALSLMKKLYDPFVRTGAPIMEMDVRSAEMTKYVSNAMLATKISFINEMAKVCDAVGADINVVRKAVGSDKRIGTSFLFPGTGYGGSCFPKDVRAIENTGQENGIEMSMMKAVTQVNEDQKRYLCQKIDRTYSDGIKDKTFAVWGLAFKPKTDDMREAPSLVVINHLISNGATVQAYDPQAIENSRTHYLKDQISYGNSRDEVLKDADALILLTEWTEFRSLDFDHLKKAMKGHVIFDGRNIYSKKEVEDHGFEYHGIGC